MKFGLLFGMLVLVLNGFAQTVDLTINWSFVGVIEGYDHQNKLVVYVDGKEIGESPFFKQTSKGTYVVAVPKGKHQIYVQDFAFYEGKWDVHTVANNYSIDAFYKEEATLDINMTLDLTFDIDVEKTTYALTATKLQKKSKKTVPLEVTWIFENIVDGYDHPNRMQIYVDGKLYGISEVFLESQQAIITIPVPEGKHIVHMEGYAYYEGNWEVQTKANDYSNDVVFTKEMKFKKKPVKMDLVFDIDSADVKMTIE